MDGICIENKQSTDGCPANTSTHHECPAPISEQTFVSTEDKDAHGNTVVTLTVKRTLFDTPDVPTQNIFGMYCLPTDNTAMLEQILHSPMIAGAAEQIMFGVESVRRSMVFLGVVAVFAIVLGYVFLYMISKITEGVIHGMFFMASSMLFVTGIFIITWGAPPDLVMKMPSGIAVMWAAYVESNPLLSYMDWDQAQQITFSIGVLFLVSWAIILCIWCSTRAAIYQTCTAITEAAGHLEAMPTLLLQPTLQVLISLASLMFLFSGLMYVVSMGTVETKSPFTDQRTGITVSGLQRTFAFSQQQRIFIGCWLFGALWVYYFLKSMSQYAVAHAVAVQHYRGDAGCAPLSRGYMNGVVYHMGSVAFAAFLFAMLGLPTLLMQYFTKQMQSKDKKKNMVVDAMGCCCASCIACLHEVMTVVDDLAYVEIAAFGVSYCTAMRNVMSTMAKNPVAFVTQEFATRVVKILGVLLIGGGGTFVCYWVIRAGTKEGFFGGLTKTPILRNTARIAITIASGIICTLIAVLFMVLVDIVTGCLMYLKVKGDAEDEKRCRLLD